MVIIRELNSNRETHHTTLQSNFLQLFARRHRKICRRTVLGVNSFQR